MKAPALSKPKEIIARNVQRSLLMEEKFFAIQKTAIERFAILSNPMTVTTCDVEILYYYVHRKRVPTLDKTFAHIFFLYAILIS